MVRRKKISDFSESLERKSVGDVPLTMTDRPQVQYPRDKSKSSNSK